MGVETSSKLKFFSVNSGHVIAKFGLFLAEISYLHKIVINLREAQNFVGLFQPNERKFTDKKIAKFHKFARSAKFFLTFSPK